MNITFRQMRLFLALADTGSVSGAARALHVTQPTASMQLREVTEAVGLPLYEVIGRRVHLTDAGRDLAATARAIVDAWENFGQRVNAMHGSRAGACAWPWSARPSTSYRACWAAFARSTRTSRSR
jgi:DNA-binding transcriptional LysR family regulator